MIENELNKSLEEQCNDGCVNNNNVEQGIINSYSEICQESYIEENIILLNKENVENVVIDRNLFEDGVKKVSLLCGMISALCSVGITPSMALSYIENKESSDKICDYNLKVSKINANANIESSKYGMSGVQKMMI